MMGFHLLLKFSLLSLLLAATTDASLPAEDYWKSVLPNTPFPKTLEDLLQQNDYKKGEKEKDGQSKKYYRINFDYKDKINENDDAKDDMSNEHYGNNLDYKRGEEVKDGQSKEYYRINFDYRDKINENDDAKDDMSNEHYGNNLGYKKGEKVKDGQSKEYYRINFDYKDKINENDDAKDDTSNEPYGNNLDYKKGGQEDDGMSKEYYRINLDYKDKNNGNVGAKDDMSNEHYGNDLDYKKEEMVKDGQSKEHYRINFDYKESKNTVSDDGTVNSNWMDAAKGDFSYVARFYLPGDLYPGRRMKLHFNNVGSRVGFLPSEIAKSIPFSSDHISKILEHFAIKAGSEEANSIADVIDLCEGPEIEGEQNCCPSSLESMIDCAVTRLGKIGAVLSSQPAKKQEYTVLKEPKKMGDKALVCHKNIYPYALYYCHEMKGTKAYSVPLLGADGTRIKAATICHVDTAGWNPNEKVFQILKAKPGMIICHFLANDALVWVPAEDPVHEVSTHLSKPIMDQ